MPPQNPGSPRLLHRIKIAFLGMPLADSASVDELAQTCAELGVVRTVHPTDRGPFTPAEVAEAIDTAAGKG
jgi:hypothetical protein